MVRYTKHKGQDYSTLRSTCKQTGLLFEDPEFPATNKSLFFTSQRRPSKPNNIVWKRPKHISTDAHFFVDGATCADVSQGKLGNCWFVAAAASLCEDRELWKKVIPDSKTASFFPDDPDDYQGIFRFRFWRFGEWTEVVIDDRLPTINGKLVYVRSDVRHEFWSALLEKAYAKLAGSYEALDGGNAADALVDFTGGVSETVELAKKEYPKSAALKKNLHKRMRKLMERNALCSGSIKVTNRDEMEQKLDCGLVKGHAYSILAVKTVALQNGEGGNVYLVKLRNPWGSKEWTGPWSDESEEWGRLREDERTELDIKVADDGEFWMSWDDFCSYFTHCVICALVNTAVFTFQKTYHEGKFKGRWRGKRAGGCINNKETFLNNPQYVFDVPGNKPDIAFVSLMQPDTRSRKHSGGKNIHIGFYVMRVESNREHRVHYMYDCAADSVYINRREVFERLLLNPGRYVIIPTTWYKGEEGEFLLRVYTDEPNYMKELVFDKPNTRRVPCLPLWKIPTTQMTVIIMEVKDIVKKSAVSMTLDPYCIIECEGTRVTTPTVTDTGPNPHFDYGGLFYVRNPDTATLRIGVWDRNILMPDTYLGGVATYVRCNEKMMLHTLPLMELGQEEVKAGGTVIFKLAISNKLGFM